jgi:hypothetical protein
MNAAMPGEQAQRMARPTQPQGPGVLAHNWDATKTDAPPEVLESGFQLAYFIIPDRSSAIDILVRALDKVRVQSRRETKRLYWRDKHSERPVRRMVRNDLDMLQWLILFESERNERAQERTRNVALQGMVVRYIKHLVQITTALSSFYVNIGLTRLLYNYSTTEAQRAYELLMNRYLGADEYRRAKATLLKKIAERFGDFVRITRVEHGELRLEPLHDQMPWVGLVDSCLRVFTPWSTRRFSSQFAAVDGDKAKLIAAVEVDRNDIELKCCHIFIEPQCFRQLLRELAFEPPAAKLALPRFDMSEKEETTDGSDHRQGIPPELSTEELAKIERRLAATDARRRNLDPRFVTVVIDDEERARLNLTESRQWQIEVEEGANLLEIQGEDQHGKLVLSTHLISYVNETFDFATDTAMLAKGRLKFQVAPVATSERQPARAVLSLNYYPRFSAAPFSTAWRAFTNASAVRSYALAGLTTALIVCGAAGVFYAHRASVLEQQLRQAHRNPQQLSPTAARAIVSYTLVPDDLRVRGSMTGGIPEISLRLHSSAVALELPLSEAPASGGYSAELKTFAGNRTLVTQNSLKPTRSDTGWIVEIVFPADLLEPDSYYTVHLHSPDTTGHFTFKAVAGQ